MCDPIALHSVNIGRLNLDIRLTNIRPNLNYKCPSATLSSPRQTEKPRLTLQKLNRSINTPHNNHQRAEEHRTKQHHPPLPLLHVLHGPSHICLLTIHAAPPCARTVRVRSVRGEAEDKVCAEDDEDDDCC